MTWQVVLLAALLSSGCSPPLGSHARLRGYSTLCNGTLTISSSEAAATSSSLDVPAGYVRLFVVADSEPQMLDGWPTAARTLCYFRSTHMVSFEAKGAHVYRLHLNQEGPQDFSISVHEGIDSSAVETIPVDAASQQLGIEEKCGFMGGGWCPRWTSD